MDKMTEYLVRAADELGLAITAPFRCDLGDETAAVAVARFPELGGVNGMLVFRSSQFDRKVCGILRRRGFACSSFGDPLEAEQFDLEAYREMFADWGWASESKEPPLWMTSA
jgi:hypothetical protein